MNPRLAIFATFTLFWASNVHAYLDPGTGSIVLQSVIAAAVAGVYTVKIYWHSIKSFFGSRFGKKDLKRNEEETNDAE